jgi:hypothetical protein
MKPNFTQGSVINSLERENQYLRAQAQAMSQTTKLIEAAVTGLSARLTSPKEIAEQAIQIAGAVITELEKLSTPEPA